MDCLSPNSSRSGYAVSIEMSSRLVRKVDKTAGGGPSGLILALKSISWDEGILKRSEICRNWPPCKGTSSIIGSPLELHAAEHKLRKERRRPHQVALQLRPARVRFWLSAVMAVKTHGQYAQPEPTHRRRGCRLQGGPATLLPWRLHAGPHFASCACFRHDATPA